MGWRCPVARSLFSFWTQNPKRQSPRYSPRTQIALESLEDRCLLSWDPVPPATLPAGAAGAAVSLGGLGDARGNAAITNREVDYYDLTAPLTGNYTIRATTPPTG